MNTAQSTNIFRNLDKGPFITITQPSHFTSASLVKDRIYFKNSFKQAEELFNEKYPDGDFKGYEEKLIKCSQDDDFWLQGSYGVMIVVSAENIYMERLGTEVSEDSIVKPTVVVGDVPYLLPLIKAYQDVSHYYLLALNRDSFHVFEVYGEKVERIELPEEAPTVMEEYLDDNRDTGLLRYKSLGSSGLSYHGHGGAKEESDVTRNSYFNIVDRYLRESDIINQDLPIRLLSLEINKSRYINLSKLSNVDEDLGIIGSPQSFEQKDIEENVRELNQLTAKQTMDEMKAHYHDYFSKGLTNSNYGEILELSEAKRIDSLILTLELLKTPDEKVNELVVKTLEDDGNIYVVHSKSDLPQEQVIALTHY